MSVISQRAGVPAAIHAEVERAPWPIGGGEAAALVRSLDWSKTLLGAIATWPPRLMRAVEMILGCDFPMVVMWGPDLVQVYNDGYRAFIASKHPSAMGQRTRECWPETWSFNEPVYQRVFRGETITFEDQLYSIIRNEVEEEEEVCLTICNSPLRDESGAVAGVLVALTEKTVLLKAEEERRAMDKLLRESEARYRALAEATVHALYRLSADGGTLLEVHGAGLLRNEHTAGSSAEWLSNHVHPEDRQRTLAAWHAAIEGQTPYRMEHRGRRADGTWGWLLSRAVPVRDAANEVVEWIGSVIDVGASKEAEAALRSSEPRQSFVIKFGDRLREFVDDADVIMGAATGMTGEYLAVSRVGYAEIDEAGGRLRISNDWTDGRLPSAAGDRVLGDLGAELVDALRSGRTVRIDDTRIDLHTNVQRVAAALSAAGVRATVIMPVLKQKCLVAAMFVDNVSARRWTIDEVGLLREIAERTWSAVERARSERRLRDSERRFRALTETTPQIVWSTTPPGTADYFSQRWYEYTGLPIGPTLSSGWREALHPDDLERALTCWRHSVSSGEDYEVEYRLRGANGAYRWFLARAVPLRDAQGNIERWFGNCVDIEDMVRARELLTRGHEELAVRVTERTVALQRTSDALQTETLEHAKSEDALRQSQKMEAMGQLTGGVAHDFNNMLQAIEVSLELIKKRIDQGRIADTTRYIATATDAVERAAGLTRRLLAFARRQTLEPKPARVDKLVSGLEELLRRTLGSGIRLQLQLHEGWTVLCDTNQLESALLNLCINARDAMPNGGDLFISTQDVHIDSADLAGQGGVAAGDYAMIAVKDSGIGMSAAVMARAFEPFFTTKRPGEGTGLGLSQIYGFVRQSNGFMRLDSAPGQGTTVRVCLPRHDSAVDEVAVIAESTPAQGNGQTILLVEDASTTRDFIVERLRELGYRVMEAADGIAAQRALHGAAKLDLLITDIGLPGRLNGRQLAEAVRRRWPQVGVLFITGYAGDTFKQPIADGMQILTKPFTLDDLAKRVRQMFEQASG